MSSDSDSVSMGDNVLIRRTAETEVGGYANRRGVCYGFTTPSLTGVTVIGAADDDFALSVHFEDDTLDDAWFDLSLVQLIDHAPGTEITIGDMELVRDESGDWVQEPKAKKRWPFRREI